MITTPDVSTQSEQVISMLGYWDKVDALIGGTKAMRLASERYMPKRPFEDHLSFSYRCSSNTLFNAFGRTINSLSAKPFEKPLKYTDMPEIFQTWFENADLTGRNLDVFAKEWFKTSLTYGVSYVLVDYPVVENVKTKADERAIGARPYLIHIHPRNILGWKSEKIKGVQTLTQVRIMECVEEDDGPFAVKTINQVRVLYPGKWEIWRKIAIQGQPLQWVKYKESSTSLKRIPLVAFYTGRTGFMTARPVLDDLADLNLAHWASNSYQTAVLDTARVPILFVKGIQNENDPDLPPEINIGASAGVFARNPDADLKYVEHTGAAIAAGRQSLLDIEEQMRLIGAELLVKKPGNMTATQAALDIGQQQSELSAYAEQFGDALDEVAQIMADWAGIKVTGNIAVYNDFSVANVDAATEVMLLNAAVAGKLSDETLFEELKRRSTISPDLDWEQEKERIKSQPVDENQQVTQVIK